MSQFNNLNLYDDAKINNTSFDKYFNQEMEDFNFINDGISSIDDLSDIAGQTAVLGKLPLIQMRNIEKKIKAPELYGEPTEREKQIYEELRKRDKEEKVYNFPIIT